MALGANMPFETGIPSLDLLLGGGIPRRQSLMVTGSPGGGKTILVNQIAFLAAPLPGSARPSCSTGPTRRRSGPCGT